MSLYADGTFLDDAQLMLADFGITFTDSAGNTFLAMVTDPSVTQALQAGGFLEQTSFTAKVAAATSAWTASDGRVGGSVAALSGWKNCKCATKCVGIHLIVHCPNLFFFHCHSVVNR